MTEGPDLLHLRVHGLVRGTAPELGHDIVLSVLPVVLIDLLFERRISGGLTGGAVKG